MGVITHDLEVPSTIPPSKMFKGLILNGDILIPKVQPLVIKSVEILEGDGGAGTIKLVTFGEGHIFTMINIFRPKLLFVVPANVICRDLLRK